MQICHGMNGCFPPETAVAVGFFDGIHIGHQAVVARALAHRREKMAAVVFSFTVDDTVPARKKNAHWLMSSRQKAARLSQMGVDLLLEPPFSAISGMAPEEFARFLAEDLHARAVCCGYDYRFGKGACAGAEDLRRLLAPYGAVVETVDAVIDDGEPVSSTRIRALLEAGELLQANRLLGAPFALEAPVIHGRGLGHSIGFPTANQRFPEGFLVPKYGVYATRVLADGAAYPAVTNIGVKPTVGGDTLPGAESNLLDFSGDLYGKTICVEFLGYLRAEQNFGSVEALSAQIACDAERARNIFKNLPPASR